MFEYDGLQLSDFIGSYASFIITLVTMSILPRSTKASLFILGLLICISMAARNRFDTIQLSVFISITAIFTISTWVE